MKNEAIDPVEILLDERRRVKQKSFRLAPLTRFLGRFIDYSLCLLAFEIGGFFLQRDLFFSSYHSFIPLEFFIWIFVESLSLAIFGTTPGKHFLHIRLHQKINSRLNLRAAMTRSLSVWFRGLGMMVPYFLGICLFVAYYRLQTTGTTSWDKDENITVSYLPPPRWRIGVSTCFVVLVFFTYFKTRVM